jgi:hypothetical protein
MSLTRNGVLGAHLVKELAGGTAFPSAELFEALADAFLGAGFGGYVEEALGAGSLPAAVIWAAKASGMSRVICMGRG